MEDALNLKYGLAGVCVLLTLYILLQVVKFVYDLKEEKQSVSEKTTKENTDAIRDLTLKMASIQDLIAEFPKHKKDVKRFYIAIKSLAGDKWSAIRDEILEDDFTL